MNRRRSLWIGPLALVAVLVSGGAAIRLVVRMEPSELKIGRAESMAYRDLLVRSLREEGTVTIIEHSSHGDRPNSGATGELEEYRRIKLDPRLVAELARRLEAMDTDPQIAVMMCFSPHHSIEFSPAAGEPSRMLVCFGCHRVEWDLSEDGVPPAALIGLLEQFFQELGLRPRADWSGLAEPRAVNGIGRGSRMSQNEMVRSMRNNGWLEEQRVPDVNAPSR